MAYMEYIARNSFEEVPLYTNELHVRFPITNFDGLERLKNLEQLYLQDSNLKSFKDFPYLPKLEQLSCNTNKIQSFQYLPNLEQLRVLYLCKNNIRSFKYLPDFPNVDVIYLVNNKITSFSHFPSLSKLRFLYLNDNSIRSFRYFFPSSKLKELDISDNKISSFKWISLDNFKKTSIYDNYFQDYSDEIIERLLSKNLEDHQDAIIKNINKDDVLFATSFVKYMSNFNVKSLIFAIKNNIQTELNKDFIFQNKDFIESMCVKYNNTISNKILNYIQIHSKQYLKNGDTVCF